MKLYFLFIWVRRQGATPVSLANQSLGILPFLLFLVLGVVPAAVFSSAGELKIVSSTASEFHFTLIVDPAQLDWFYDSDSLVSGFTTVQIGIPPGSQPRLVLAEGRQPVEIAEDFFRGRRPSSNSFPLAEVSRTSAIRGRRLVSVRIFPILERRIYTEVEIKVIFTGAAVAAGTVSPDPHFERIFSAVIANYDQFKTWPAPTRTVGKLSLLQPGPFSGVDEWFKISVDQTGLYRVTGLELESAGLNLVNLPSDEVHLYYGGGLPLAVPNEEPRPEFVEIPVILEDGGDGSFDRGDQLLFFGESQDRWVYSGAGGPGYVNNPYCDGNVYWLTISSGSAGLRMSSRNDPPSGVVVSSFRRYVRAEQDNMLRYDYAGGVLDYYSWYWTDESSLTFYLSSPGVIGGDTADILAVAKTGGTYVDLSVNGTVALNKLCSYLSCTFNTVSLVDGLNRFDVQLSPPVAYPPYFDYLELAYTSANIPSEDRLDLTVGRQVGSIEIEVTNRFSATPLVLDVSDGLDPVIVPVVAGANDIISFNSLADSSVFRRFYLTPRGQALAPRSVSLAVPEDLYAVAEQTDLIVISREAFLPALDTYLNHRRSSGYSVKAVSVEDIMDNFAYGLYDPTAIRDFFKYAYENYPAPAPAAVLLVGDANYDYLDNLSTNTPNHVPVYIHALDQSASDDNYVYFGSYGILDSDTSYSDVDRGFDMISSRWPVRSSDEIAVITANIQRYESASHFGIWRNRITLVADDEHTRTSSTETIHTIQTELLASDHIPNLFAQDKIYLWEYPFVGSEKPEVNNAIVKAINDGTLIVNYVGHGNPDVWAHEHVFVRADDLPRLNNYDRLPLVFVASCAIGFFDDPLREGMAEDFLAIGNGGAIGVVSATRSVFSSANAEFNQAVFDILLYHDTLSMCEAVYAAKLARQYVGDTPIPLTNDRKFLFLGGPFVSLAIPRLDIEFTEAPDSIVALGKTSVSGRVVDESMATYGYDGVLFVNVYDSEREKVYRLVNSDGVVVQEVAYTVTGPTIYRGSATIADGVFNFEFVSPLDVGYGGEGAKISAYAQFESIDAAGIVDSIAVSQTVAASTDSAGPSVTVTFAGTHDFVSGDMIAPNDQMLVTISDASGVNLTGALGHGITLEIDYVPENLINLTPYFEASRDDYTTGSLVYPVGDLTAGDHHFKIKAWDNANNSSVYEFDAEILSSDKLAIRDLLNYPNPMRESTRFSFYLTQPVEKFSLDLFTLSGKKIKTIYRHSLDRGFYDDIEWYGTDTDGSRVATEVYIYKATAHSANGGEKAESFGKLVLIN